MFRWYLYLLATVVLLQVEPGLAQEHAHPGSDQAEAASNMPGMDMESDSPAESALMLHSSGTAYQPRAWPMPMLMSPARGWNLMWMGQGFIAATQQSGPRGRDKIYSSNWGMFAASRARGNGSFMFRTMLSLEPATITDRVYPLLFQTGETAFGEPIVDGQHPHDLFMELSAQYAHAFTESVLLNAYYGAVGDPALGPTAFPHRASAMEIPQAAISHHWQDSTHIANNVLTIGVALNRFRIEASGFHGEEPDEGRWNIDFGKMDSWSTRLSVFPTSNWMAQVSVGRLEQPEQLHDEDVVRITGSVQHILPTEDGNSIATSLVWGRNHQAGTHRNTNTLLLETVVPFSGRNFLTGRVEWSQRDELFANDHELEEAIEEQTGSHAFNVTALTVGYTRDVFLTRYSQVGIGINISAYSIADPLKPFYGARPWGATAFLRVRLRDHSSPP